MKQPSSKPLHRSPRTSVSSVSPVLPKPNESATTSPSKPTVKAVMLGLSMKSAQKGTFETQSYGANEHTNSAVRCVLQYVLLPKNLFNTTSRNTTSSTVMCAGKCSIMCPH